MPLDQSHLKIIDENGDLDELKCLQLLFTPQLCTVSINSQLPIKAFILVKASECFYSELNEGYTIKLLDYPTRKILSETKMSSVESIIMKNIIQRQFLISAENGKVKLAVEVSDKNDLYFQALNYIFQKTAIKRY